MADKVKKSAFAEHGWRLLERGISVVPIAPGTKRPGEWSKEHGWRGMRNWTEYAKRFPTSEEMRIWETWPDAGLGVITGKLSNLTGIDKDYDIEGHDDALLALLPYTSVKKRGEKGFTALYQYNGERSCSFDVNGQRVLDILSDGRQTVVPPSPHPSGCSYVWISEQTLEDLTNATDLPKLPDDFIQKVELLLAPLQTDLDKKYQKKVLAPKEETDPINTTRSIQAEYFHDLNQRALANLEQWITKLVPTAKPEKDGFRAVATWRGAENPNVGIHPTGIRDWGGNYGMTPIDIVMYANNLPFGKAAEALRACLTLNEPEPITLSGFAPAAVAKAPAVMPWKKPMPVAAAPMPKVQLPPTTSIEPAVAVPPYITNPPGILKDIADWITATAPKSQPELSLAAAIALAATVTQRIYKSNLANFTSLYVVMVAKSTEGKEHPQSSVERALTSAGFANLIAGSGYTSSGAVFSALLKQPSHIAVIDEMGKLLKLSRAKGNANGEAAIDKLVEAFGRLNGIMRPPTYSSMSMSAKQIKESSINDRVIHKPAITILGATTPATFYGSLTDDLVSDGFLGRLIVVESVQPRQLARYVDQTDPPAKVVEWLQAVHSPTQRQGNLAEVSAADLEPVTVEMVIDPSCEDMMRAFELQLNELKDQLEPEKLDVLLGRTFEKSLRLAMIAAKACDYNARDVRLEHLQWAQEYVMHYDMALVRAVRKNRMANQTDGDLKKAIEYIKSAKTIAKDPKINQQYKKVLQDGAMPHALLLKKMHMKAREFDELMKTAREAAIINVMDNGLHLGYGGQIYYANDD